VTHVLCSIVCNEIQVGRAYKKNLLIPAAVFFSLDATSGLLATASASAPAMFLALRSALLCACVCHEKKKKKKV